MILLIKIVSNNKHRMLLLNRMAYATTKDLLNIIAACCHTIVTATVTRLITAKKSDMTGPNSTLIDAKRRRARFSMTLEQTNGDGTEAKEKRVRMFMDEDDVSVRQHFRIQQPLWRCCPIN